MKIVDFEDLRPHSSMKIGGIARAFGEITTEEEILEAAEKSKGLGLPLHILGEGSNTIFTDGELNLFVAKIKLLGFVREAEDNQSMYIRIRAGEHWDNIVKQTVDEGLAGLEALSAIPGTAGATPVQNVGAYGAETKDILVELEAFDRTTNKFVTISNDECKFEYRKSIFNSTDKNRFVISSILLKLSKKQPRVPDYPGVRSYFAERNITSPSLLEIRQAIVEIRANKLPDPSIIPNCGSFFKNAIITLDHFNQLKEKFPDIVSFPVENGIKIPAGWLIEKAGFKGKSFGPMGTFEKNALVLVNKGGATTKDLFSARDQIISKIKDEFSIILEQEPLIVR